MNFSEFTTKSCQEVFEILKTREDGLSEKEAKERQEIYGLNEIKERRVKTLEILIRQFKSAFFYLLFIAGIIYFSLGEIINGILILIFVFINVFLGFFQEYRAERAVQALKKYLAQKIRVKRDGKEIEIDKKFLVPGDIVFLEAGDIAPADLRILKAKNFLVDESILTGESIPRGKISQVLSKEAKEIFEAENIVFCGSEVISGEGEGIVVAIGENTLFGKIAQTAQKTTQLSIFEKNLLSFSKIVLKIVVAIIILVFLANLIIKGEANLFEFLIFSIALIVGMIPEALSVVVTFAFSQGALKLAKKKVVVKRLSSIEDLGDIEILCTDKTGTLTENKLTLEEVFSFDKEKCLLYGLLSSTYMKEEIESLKTPFDTAIFQKTPKKIKILLEKFELISEIPFDPERLVNSVLVKNSFGKNILIVKGAPEKILKISQKFKIDKKEIEREIEKAGKDGKRVLAIGFKELEKNSYSEEDEKDLTFLGYFSFFDPLKKTAKPAIDLARKLGLEIKILTGDSKEVAGKIAKEIGLISNENEVILGETLNFLKKEEFEKECLKYKVFARVSPEMKFKIIKALQGKFEIGFLGEGINDLPALKAADVAIVVKSAADVAREAADIILLKKDLKVIVKGILEGRNIFANVNKYIKTTLSSNFGNSYSLAFISLLIPYLPMLPIQILLVNLFTDLPLISIAMDKVEPEELKKPKTYSLKQLVWLIILLAFVSSLFDFIFFGIFRKSEPETLRTLWFILSIFTEILLIFSIRTRHFFLKAKPPHPVLIFLSIFALFLATILPFTNFGQEIFQLSLSSVFPLLIVFFLALVYFIVTETVKLIYFSQTKLNQPSR